MMVKTFVLDTNVLLHDPNAMLNFAENEVVIPIQVIEEIDGFKKDLSELGRNARYVARSLDELRSEGTLLEGVKTPGGGLLSVAITQTKLPVQFQMSDTTDNRILATALECQEKWPQKQIIFVSKDVNLRVRADALGLTVEDFDTERVHISELYSGVAEIEVAADKIDAFYQDGQLPLDDAYYFPGQFAFLKSVENEAHTALGRVNVDKQIVEPMQRLPERGFWGVRPRNREQCFALDLLVDDEMKLVTLVGKAGTGKTLLALAAGLQKVVEDNIYQRLLVARPIFPLGRDIGYLPGDIEDKLMPWMQPIFDNVELLLSMASQDREAGKGQRRGYEELMDMGVMAIEPLTYIRGRSIPNQYIIVDEAQNLTPHEVKTIISRAGENTKIVLTGDPYQIDNPYVDATNNGLVHAVNRFQAERIAGHLSLYRGERSELAELATQLL